MNRYLSIPLALTLVAFCGVYFSKFSYGEPFPPITSNETTVAGTTTVANAAPMSFEDARIMILDEWPTLGVNAFASRMGPTQPLYATLGPVAELGEDNNPDLEAEHLHCSLYVSARPMPKKNGKKKVALAWHSESKNYAIHIDRYTREIMIFDNQWQSYATWKKTALPYYIELTGWNAQSEELREVISNDSVSTFDKATIENLLKDVEAGDSGRSGKQANYQTAN